MSVALALRPVVILLWRLIATTGEGEVLGNMVYNVAHLLDPGGALNLLTILNLLAL
jgi:hypothetical protein